MDIVPRVSASRRSAGCSPIAQGTSACRAAAGFRFAARAIQRFAARAGLGRAESLARPAAERRCCRGFTTRPRASSPRPTRISIRRSGPELVTLPVPGHRRKRIAERLARQPRATLTDMQSLQYDVVSVQARRAAANCFCRMPDDAAVKSRLAAWDCSYSAGEPRSDALSPGSIAMCSWRSSASRRIASAAGRDRLAADALSMPRRAGFSTMVLTLIDRLLRTRRVALVAAAATKES